MRTVPLCLSKPYVKPLGLGILLALALFTSGPGAPSQGISMVDDWTHHRLVFSSPGSPWEAMLHGRYDHWRKIVSDPRFSLQLQKRFAAASSRLTPVLPLPTARSEETEPATEENDEPGDEAADSVPVVTGPLPRGLSLAPIAALKENQHERHGRRARGGRTKPINTDWSVNMGSGARAGLGVYPAKFSFGVTAANCGTATRPDFVVYNTSLAGGVSQASIIGYVNLYTGCTGTIPSVYWAYNTGGTILTSVVLSLDGSQVAFVQSSSGVASLVLLKWARSTSETASSPLTLTPVAASAYRSCVAPCMTSLTFIGGADDSGSSPFVDYTSDILYVGDDGGHLHKFSGVFNGTPAEASSSWPVAVSSSALDGPVFDGGSGNIFVGDYLLSPNPNCGPSGTPCGFLYSVNASTGAVAGTSSRLDFINGIVDSPLVDSSAGMVYVFAGSDGNFNNLSSPCGANTACSGVFQFPTNFTTGSGTEATLGPGTQFLLAGTFDNTYFTSGSASSPSGHLYAVGNTGAANNTLYQVSINSNVMSTTATAGPVLSNNFTNGFLSAGLQVTEFFSGTQDFIFTSVLSFGAPSTCSPSLTTGCIMGFDVTSGSINGSTAPTGATAEAGGTSGIIIDNSSGFTGAANIYFTTLANQLCTTSGTTGGCAIQTSQATP